MTFIKTHQHLPRGYDLICYADRLSADGTEIEGSWQIPRDGSSKFLMISCDGVAEAIFREVSEFL